MSLHPLGQARAFGGGVEIQPMPDGNLVRRRVREFTTELSQRRMNEGTNRFPPVADRVSRYDSHTYRLGASGQIVYEKGNDRVLDGDRCAIPRLYLDQLEVGTPVRLGIEVAGF